MLRDISDILRAGQDEDDQLGVYVCNLRQSIKAVEGHYLILGDNRFVSLKERGVL